MSDDRLAALEARVESLEKAVGELYGLLAPGRPWPGLREVPGLDVAVDEEGAPEAGP